MISRRCLRNEMNNNEVDLVRKSDRMDIWQKDCLVGQWFLKCYYNLDLKFMYADIYYESKVLPFIKRKRSYPQSP